MKQAYLIKQGVEEFAPARQQFAVIVAKLQSAAVLSMEHGEVERLIVGRHGTLEAVLQAHFDLRTGERRSARRACVVPMASCEARYDKDAQGELEAPSGQ